ncbi:MAG: protein kinase domain-containing protein [Candidatus Eiseniibacteriota bacterium]
MNGEQWRRLKDLFVDLQGMPEGERSAHLDREAAGDPEVRAELHRLLAVDRFAADFLAAAHSASSHGSIGPYRLLEILGEGGFGVVYLAEQERPIRRRVALKLIKPGMDTKQVIARFEAERQALALMDHPGIAQVHDAGETEAGRPYFVMEYVPGEPITTFCDRERLRIPERLELFLEVCDAIQHAHHKSVIHRDIKPSNVLVALRDGVPAPKVIDFGIVKATTAGAAGQTLMTREGMIVGTLGYMSPEQAGAAETVDTRSDIYSLGALLYELLAGSPPFDADRLKSAALSDAVRVVREEEPPALAARVARGGEEEAAVVAERRSADARHLLRELKGELQWITLRALEKDPSRRYTSAAELAADIRRHLANEPVLAVAPSTAYRMRKFARRHRVGVVAATVVLATIVVGGIAAGIGFGRAVRAEHKAQREAESLQRVTDFLVELFRTSSPDQSRGETITARTLLDEGTRRIEADLEADAHIRARLLATLGDAHVNLALYDDGLRLLREAVATSEAAEPRDDLEIAEQLRRLAYGLRMAGQLDSVGVLLDRAMELGRDAGARSRWMAGCLSNKASWLNSLGQLAPADSLVTLAIEMGESEPEPDRPQLMRMYYTKGNIAHRRFELPDAERHYLRALELCESGGTEPTWSAMLHRSLASLYAALGDPERAVSHAEQGVRLARRLYASDHPNLAYALGGHAAALAGKGDYSGALAVREEALGIWRATGAQTDLARELNSVGILHRAAGQLDLAIACTEEACALYRASFGQESGRTAEAVANLARLYAEKGQLHRADSTYRAAVPVFDRLRDGSIFATYASMGFANVCRDLGRSAQAESLYSRVESALDSTEAGLRGYFGECLVDHAYLRSRQGRHDEAESMMRIGLPMQRGDAAEDARSLGAAYLTWAAARALAGDAAGAIEKLQQAARCGVTVQDAARYPELAALPADYPLESSP